MNFMNKLFFTVVLVFFSYNAVAQVTIGALEDPNRAALLDLKNHAPASDNSTTGLNGGGLQLPRVFLESRTTLAPFIPETDAEWKNSQKQADLKKKHTGLEVYNLNSNNGFKTGVYYWDGSQWQSAEDRNWTIGGNTNSSNPVLGSLNESLNLVSKSNKIILGKNSGEVYIKDLPPAPENGTVPVQIDKSGKLYAVIDNSNDYDTKPFTYIKFTIYTDNTDPGHLDWVEDFNTKINSSRFVMTIVGSALQQDNSNNTGALMKSASSTNNTFGTAQIYAFEKNGTWRIRADYAEARPNDTGTTYKWLIYALIVNKSMISDEYEIKGKIATGKTEGDAGAGYPANDTPASLL
jgi:hypothetical protein